MRRQQLQARKSISVIQMVWEGGTVGELEISRNFLFWKRKKKINKFNICMASSKNLSKC